MVRLMKPLEEFRDIYSDPSLYHLKKPQYEMLVPWKLICI